MFSIFIALLVVPTFEIEGAAAPQRLKPQCRANVCDDRPECPLTECRCLFASRIDCAIYYQCVNGKPLQYKCSPGLLFNKETLSCDYSNNVNCSFETTVEPSIETLNSTFSMLKTTTETFISNVTVNRTEAEKDTSTTSLTTNPQVTSTEQVNENATTNEVTDRTTTSTPKSITTNIQTTERETERSSTGLTNLISTDLTHSSETTAETTRVHGTSTKIVSATETGKNSETTVLSTRESNPVTTTVLITTTNKPEISSEFTKPGTTNSEINSTLTPTTESNLVTTTSLKTTTSKSETSSETTKPEMTYSEITSTVQHITVSEPTQSDRANSTMISTVEYETKTETSSTEITTSFPSANFECPSRFGLFADPQSCSRFYHCSHWVAYHKLCPSNLHFNPKLNVCDWPYRAGCDFETTEETSSEILNSTSSMFEKTTEVLVPNVTVTVSDVQNDTTTSSVTTTSQITTTEQAKGNATANDTTDNTTTSTKSVTTNIHLNVTETEPFSIMDLNLTERTHLSETPTEATRVHGTSMEVASTTKMDNLITSVIFDNGTTSTEESTDIIHTTAEIVELITTTQSSIPEISTTEFNANKTTLMTTSVTKESSITEIDSETTTVTSTTESNPVTTTVLITTTNKSETSREFTKPETTNSKISSTLAPITESNPVTTTILIATTNKSETSSETTKPEMPYSEITSTAKYITGSEPTKSDRANTTVTSTVEYKTERETSSTGLTTSFPSAKFECPSRFGLFADPKSCFRFYHCSHWVPYHKWCPSNLHFNPKLNVCDWPYRAGCDASLQTTPDTSLTTTSPSDDTPGSPCHCDNCVIPIPDDCSAYELCIDRVGRMLRCGNDLYFNPMTGTCDIRENVQCFTHLQCNGVGRLLYPGSCSYFLECQGHGEFIRKCPEGLLFNETSEMCGWTGSCSSDQQPEIYPDSKSGVDMSICEGCSYCFKPYDSGCTSYVRCSKDGAVEGRCAPGLYFNPRTELCDHDYNVDCPGLKPPVECPEEFGYFPHPKECGLYLQCVNGSAMVKSCPGVLHFDPVRKHCNWPWTAGCGNSTAEPIPEPSKNTTDCDCECCLKPAGKDCKSFILCINKIGTKGSCASGLLFNPETENCDFAENIDCPLSPPDELGQSCPEYQGLFPHPDDCRKFIHCDHGIPHVKNCPSDLHFNQHLKVCDWPYSAGCQSFPTIQPPSEDNNFPCDVCDSCFLPIDNDCAAYIYCRNGTGYKLRCTGNLLFNRKTEACDLPKNVDCPNSPNTRCPQSDGLFPAEDCSQFIHCSNGLAYLKDCPDGLHFNSQKLICDWPNNAKCGETPIEPPNPPPDDGGSEFNGTCDCDCCFLPNSEDCSKYFLCLDGIPHGGQCSNGLLFNPSIQNCDIAERVTCGENTPSCLQPNGLFPILGDCTSFLRCSSGTPEVAHCKNGTHFSALREQCLDPCEAKCDNTYGCFTTPSSANTTSTTAPSVCLDSEGFYPIANNCSAFYACSNGVPQVVNCPHGMHYSVEYEVCEDPCDAQCDRSLNCSFPPSSSAKSSTTAMFTSSASPPSSSYPSVCPNEQDGLYPSKDNCSTFYQCSRGRSYLMKCPHGLHFSSKDQVCEHPCIANCSKTIDCAPTTPKSTTTTLSPHCTEAEGLYPVTGDCTGFYLCSNGKEYLIHCPPGQHYSEEYEICEDPCDARCNASIECASSSKQDSSSTIQPLSPECGAPNGLFSNPEDCGSFYQCSNGRSHLISCPSGLHFSLDDAACERPCLAGCDLTIACPTEVPDTKGNCSCDNCYLPDTSDCSAFYFCTDGSLSKNYCPLGMLFDKMSGSCQEEDTVNCEANGDPSMCPASFGFFPYPGDCRKFLHCDNGVAHVKECTGSLEYDPLNKVCTKPKGYCGEIVSDPHCLEPTGLFPDPTNCSLFYHCEHGVAYSKHCSPPLMFNPEENVCDWPENVNCGKNLTSIPPTLSSTSPSYASSSSTQNATQSSVTPSTSTHIASTSQPCYEVPGVICPCACRVPTYDDCSSFFQCLEDGTACKKYCPNGLYFNKREMVCDLPSNVECRDFFITSVQRAKHFSHPPEIAKTKF